MSSTLVPVLIALTKTTTPLPTNNAPFASTSVVVTDSTGVAQAAVILTGTETPTPWAFTTSVAPGAGTVVATDLDTAGSPIGTPVSQAFTEAGSPATFPATSAISVTPVTPVASASARKA